MFPLKKVIVPTDFSDPSYVAVAAANELARAFDAELVLVHAVPPVPYYGAVPIAGPHFDIQAYQEDMVAGSEKTLKKLIEERVAKEVRSRSIVRLGDPPATVVELADEEDADVIVISTHGRTGWKRFVFGSVAEKVVRTASRPVLTIPDPNTRKGDVV